MAAQATLDFGNAMVDSEHILYALVKQKNSGAVHVLQTLMVRPEQVVEHLENIFKNSEKNSVTNDGARKLGTLLDGLHHILVGIASGSERAGGGGQFAARGDDFMQDEDGIDEIAPTDSQQRGSRRRKKLALDYFCDDYTEMAMEGKLDKIIGRDLEIQRVVQILSRKTKNNPVLLGDPGVGKTAIVEGLAQRIIEGKVPDILADKRVLVLSMANLVAGTKYRGEFEERIKRLIEEASSSENEVILFIDELHTIIGAGSGEGSLDAANILKPALSRGLVQVIGATTQEEYRKYVEKDSALARRFQPVDVPEPTAVQTIEILSGLRPHYEEYHMVNISPEAIDSAVKLSMRYIQNRFLPDKAIDLLDEACAAKSLGGRTNGKELRELRQKFSKIQKQKESAVIAQNYEKANELHQKELDIEKQIEKLKSKKKAGKKVKTVSAVDIATVMEQMTGIPVSKLIHTELGQLSQIETTLQKKIVGQDTAISSVSRAIRRSRLGLQDPKRPLGTFLFLGPTGVGKTELVKNMAREVYHDEKALIKMDMSEFSQSHTGSRLVGATAGYVGHEDGGELTEKVRRKPHSIVLFDEIEKAHKDVHNMLLQIFEEGELTDGKGRTVSFRNTIIILTSNIGANRFQKNANSIGFSASKKDLTESEGEFEHIADEVRKDLKNAFSPEFLNRIDSVQMFHPLNREAIKQIVKLQLDELLGRLKDRNIVLKIGGNVINALAKASYSPEHGAREVRRVLMNQVEHPLAEAMVSGKIVDNGIYKVSHDAKKKCCEFEKTKE
jgi:ATP-dependent Clp protease ATP-binding subunit ClpC